MLAVSSVAEEGSDVKVVSAVEPAEDDKGPCWGNRGKDVHKTHFYMVQHFYIIILVIFIKSIASSNSIQKLLIN